MFLQSIICDKSTSLSFFPPVVSGVGEKKADEPLNTSHNNMQSYFIVKYKLN